MKLTRIEHRCPCGFLIGKGLCATHDPQRRRVDSKVTRKEVLVPGAVIGGSTVLRIVNEAYVEVECGECRKPYITLRSSIIKARLRQREARCSGCASHKRKQEVA